MTVELLTPQLAEAQIAGILQTLERDTKLLVRSVSLVKLDGSTLIEGRQNLSISVRIDLHRPPAHGWAQAREIPKTAPGQPYSRSERAVTQWCAKCEALTVTYADGTCEVCGTFKSAVDEDGLE